MPANNDNNNHWTEWWSQGHITSFGTALANNYEGATRAHWHEVLAKWDDCDILDIATGNGALATLVVAYGETQGKTLRVQASDLAAIGEHTSSTDARIHNWRNQVTFFSNTPCECQPFGRDSFDLVLSQYGFEYSDIDATLAEVHRLLRPGGEFVAISHHAGSAVIKRQQQSARVYHAALQQLRLFQLLQRHLDSWGKARNAAALAKLSNKPKFQKSHNALEQALRQFAGTFPNDETAARVFCAIDDLRREAVALSPGARIAACAQEQAAFAGTQARLVDLFKAALDKTGIEHLTSRARDIGYSETSARPFLEQSGALAGWAITLTR